MPANMYAKNKVVDKTMDDLCRFMADDLNACFHEGVLATWREREVGPSSETAQAGDPPQRFWLVYTGLKGDWPWLRKAMSLKTGPTSKQICHLCCEKAT